METDDLHSRRAFVKLVGQAALAGVAVPVLGSGCTPSGGSPIPIEAKAATKHVGNVMAVAGGTLALIPTFQSKPVAAIVSAIGAVMTTVSDALPDPPKEFDAGATIKKELAHLKELTPAKIADDIIEEITKAFEQKGQGKKFDTPIVEAKGKESFILQVHADHHSLVRGADGSACEVRNVWVDWLIEKDSCDLRVFGDTARLKCEICERSDHSIHIIRQCFQYRNGETIDISYIDEDHPDAEALSFHLSHTKAFVPCRGGGGPDEDYRIEGSLPNEEPEAPKPTEQDSQPDSGADEPAFTPGPDATTGSDGGYDDVKEEVGEEE